MKQKLLSLILLVCVLSTFFAITPVCASGAASSGCFTYSFTAGGLLLESCSQAATGDIVIPESVRIDDEPYPVVAIDDMAFMDCDLVTGVTIPDSVKTIGYGAFAYCENLTSVSLGNGVQYVDAHAFNGCYKISDVDLGNSVTEFGTGAFQRCYDLQEIVIPNSVTKIPVEMFYECSNLSKITLGNQVTSIGDKAFSNTNLKEIDIPDTVTEIGMQGIYYCVGLTEITIPGSVTSFGSEAVGAHPDLTKIVLKNGITKLDFYSFAYNRKLTEVVIPESVTKIDKYAFYECWELSDIYYGGTKEQWEAIEGHNTLYNNPTIHYNYGAEVQAEKVTVDGEEKIKVTTENISDGCQIILACYQGDMLSYAEPMTKVAEQDTYYFTPTEEYTTAKVMVFENFDNLYPVIEPVFVE